MDKINHHSETIDSLKKERIKERRNSSLNNSSLNNSYYLENNSHIIIEFYNDSNEDIIESIKNKLENEKFTIIKRGNRFYLTGDELSMLFEAELNGLIKYNQKEHRYKRFKLEDYINLNDLTQSIKLDDLSKILTRSEKIRICQSMIKENIQVSKRVYIPTLGNCYPAQSFLLICLKKNIIKQIYSLHDEELNPLIKQWSNYMIFLCLLPLPINEIRTYFNENIAIYFFFIDKLIKFTILPTISYMILLFICNFNLDHPIIPILSTIAVYITFLFFVKNWKYSFAELNNEWKLDEHQIEKQFSQPRLDYKCRSGLYHSSLPIKQLIPKPENQENKRQFKTQRNTWLQLLILLILLFFYQTFFFFSNFNIQDQHQRIPFTLMIVYFLPLTLIQFTFTKFIIYRTNLEEYFISKEYQQNFFLKILILNCLVYNSIPMLCVLFASNPTLIIDVLSAQFLIKLFIDTIKDFLFPVFYYFVQRFMQIIINENKYQESEFVISESNKSNFDQIEEEWFYLIQQMIYILSYSSLYPKIIAFCCLNILIRNLMNFLKICLIFKRPLIEDDYYPKLVTNTLDYLLILTSIINFFNLDLCVYLDLIDLNISVQQCNLLIILIIFFLNFITYLLPSKSVKTRTRRQLNQLEKFALFRLFDENALNQTIDSFTALNIEKN